MQLKIKKTRRYSFGIVSISLNKKYIERDTINVRIKVRRTIKSCNTGKRLEGVKATQQNNTAFRMPRKEVVFNCLGFSVVITPGIAKKKPAKAIFATIRAMKNRMDEPVFGLPKDWVLPRSLKKFRKKLYSGLFGLIRVPPPYMNMAREERSTNWMQPKIVNKKATSLQCNLFNDNHDFLG